MVDDCYGALRQTSAGLTGSHESYASFQDLRSEMPRGCHNLSGAQTNIRCYIFMWAQMTARQNLSIIKEHYKALGCNQKLYAPKLSVFLFYHLEESVQLKINI